MKIWESIGAEIKRPVVSLVIGGVTLAIAVNAGTEALVGWFGRWTTVVVALGLTAAIVLLASPVRALREALRGRLQTRVEEIGGPVPAHRGLIVLASQGTGISSAERAIRHHHAGGSLEHCWLVTGGPESERSAAGLVEKLVGEGISMARLHPVSLKVPDADNPEAVYRAIDRIYRDAAAKGLRDDDVIGDYTGGTKSMTAGMILACASPRRHLQFMKPHRYTPDGRADPEAGSDPVLVDIRFELTGLGGAHR